MHGLSAASPLFEEDYSEMLTDAAEDGGSVTIWHVTAHVRASYIEGRNTAYIQRLEAMRAPWGILKATLEGDRVMLID